MKGRPNKEDHPWKKSLSARKAAEDRQKKKEKEKQLISQGKLTVAI